MNHPNSSPPVLQSSAPHDAEPPVVELIDALRVYQRGNTQVTGLDHLNLKIHRGEFVSIMGTSGSGKSTMLNVLGTLDRLNGGHYLLDGIDVTALSDTELSRLRSQKIGFVFQSFHLLPRYNALENVELPMIYSRIPRRERLIRAQEALARVGLAERMDHLPTELSGGQQQRVSIARALVNRPSLLLADEPTGALDSATSREILNLFLELNRAGVTIVMVTHDPEVARTAQRVIHMKDARIVQEEITP